MSGTEVGFAVSGRVAGKVAENLLVDRIFNPIWNRIARVFKWKTNLKNLEKEVKKPEAERDSVLQFRDAAERRGEEAVLKVKIWLTDAEKYIGEMEKLEDDEDKAKKKCFLGEAEKFKIPDSHCPPKSTAPVNKGFEDFGSRTPDLDRIMEALRSTDTDKIGVYGMPGVGKTMLAKEVARRAGEAHLFDVVVLASVTKDPDLKRIQGVIADKLGLQLHGETEFGRANQLKAYLKKKKRILVILDDIWSRLDLDELGIPFEERRNEAWSRLDSAEPGIPFEEKKNEASSIDEEQMQCRILCTSRSLNVLQCDMRTNQNFYVCQLRDEEAWELLKKIVGDKIENFGLRDTAMEIAKECAGLPLAIETLGNALKDKEHYEWRDALLQLKKPSPENFMGISANVYSAIELKCQYNRRSMRQGANIELRGLEVLSLSGSAIEELPVEIGQLIQLKFLNLSDCTKLKLIRPHVLESLSRLEELYLGNSFKQWEANGLGNQRNPSLAELKDLHNLVALDVHACDVQLIPEDLFSERLNRYKIFIGEELKYLYVQNAPEIQHIINSVGEIPCYVFPLLEVLFLQNLNNMVKICHGQLAETSFRRLRTITVECCNQLECLFPISIARRLLQLEEVRVTDCSNMLEIVDDEGQVTTNDIAEANENFEFAHLRFLNLQYLPKFIRLCHGLVEANDSRSKPVSLFNEKVIPKLEKLSLASDDITMISDGQFPGDLFCNVKVLRLLTCKGQSPVFPIHFLQCFHKLEKLHVIYSDFKELFPSEGDTDGQEKCVGTVQLHIRELKLRSLHNLRHICNQDSGGAGLIVQNLKILKVIGCPGLISLSASMAPFHSLTTLVVFSCQGLRNLVSLSTAQSLVVFLSLEKLIIWEMRSLIKIWNEQLDEDSFHKLYLLCVSDCEKLLNIFPVNMVGRLQNLGKLLISNCASLEEIFEPQGLDADESEAQITAQLALVETTPNFVFPKVTSLDLWLLPNLKSFYTQINTTEWPLLKKLEMIECDKVQILASELLGISGQNQLEIRIEHPLFWVSKVTFSNLEELIEERNKDLKEVWQGDDDVKNDVIFTKLKSL
ncbi:hypothetical protein SLEP1_g14187 [Rubroshorea leprosula]|uniref:AAA+ ATPase domain-containing protein n=1 Tax=Rubroshorea leprosula TaxID=152421 RepID=A0AAV5ITR1_9ROSI|nr:hypothetical protein SLEP1_g14187 [Rubroshorea leprosula]